MKNLSVSLKKLCALFFLLASLSAVAQNKYGLTVLENVADYKATVADNEMNKLLDIEDVAPTIQLDIRYATKNNFTGEIIYNAPKAYTRAHVAKALARIQKQLAKQNIGLKIFDAYRPYDATLKFYEVYGDTNFVASPWTGSRHNRACAVDVSLIDLSTGKELEMPTAFDDFSEKAAPDYEDVSAEAKKNRDLLIRIMDQYGFSVNEHEWWHYDMKGWENFQLLNLSFDDLKKIQY